MQNKIREWKPFIGNEWASTESKFDIRSPWDAELAGVVCAAGEKELEAALNHATKAFEVSLQTPTYKRAEVLSGIVHGIIRRREELAHRIVLDAGKPIAAAKGEVNRAISTFKLAADEATRMYGEILPLDINDGSSRRVALVRRYPLGPVLGITPFNFPINLVAHKVAPALATGCPIILKPASSTPTAALILAEIALEAGIPSGMFQVVPCAGPSIERLVDDSRIKMISFTGSVDVGWKLRDRASRKRVALELGGNASAIVEPDCDLDHAVQRCIWGAYAYSGQVCISLQRIYIHDSIYERFVERFVAGVKRLKMGNPLDESTDYGPMITESEAKRIEAWVNEAIRDGAKLLAGGKREGNRYYATVLVDVKPGMKVVAQEAFAPLATAIPYSYFDEAIEMANESRYGLQAGVFTRSIDKAMMAFNRLDVGGIVVNDAPTVRVDNYPYGGNKDSGSGREGVRYAMEEMTNFRTLIIDNPV